MHLFSFKVMKV